MTGQLCDLFQNLFFSPGIFDADTLFLLDSPDFFNRSEPLYEQGHDLLICLSNL